MSVSDEEAKVLSDIRERMVRVETKIDNMNNAKDIAQEALLSARSAHHRLNTHVRVGLILFGATASALAGAFFYVITNFGG